MKLVSILIVNWNTGRLLVNCLKSIEQTIGQNQCEVIVVDNASTDDSLTLIEQDFKWITLIKSDVNLGFARANNLAIERSNGEYVLLLNPDTVLYDKSIIQLIDLLETDKKIGLVGPRLVNKDGSLQISAYPEPTLAREAWRLFHLDCLIPLSRYPLTFWKRTQPQLVDIVTGACLLFRREIYRSLGLFDEQFFVYSEEVDFCKRVTNAGWLIYYVPSSIVMHYGARSTRQVEELMFLELYKNKIKYFRKNLGSNTANNYKKILWIASYGRLALIRGKMLVGKDKPKLRTLHNLYKKLLLTLPEY